MDRTAKAYPNINKLPIDLIPIRYALYRAGPRREDDQRFRWSVVVWWACQDLNLGPHPDPRIDGEQVRGSIRAEPGSNQVDLVDL